MQIISNVFEKLQHYEKTYWFIPYIYAVFGNITIVMMQICMKVLSRTLNSFFILYIRGILLLAISCVVVRMNHLNVHYQDKGIYSILFKRTIFSSSSLILFIGTVPFLPIGIINSLFNIGPVIIHFLEAFYYKKHIEVIHFMLTIVCFTGVLLIIKPGFLFGDVASWPLIFLIFPLFGALFNSISMLYLHELKGKVSNLIALHYFYLGQIFLTGILQNFQQFEIKQQITWLTYLNFFGLVIFAYLTQNCITRAIYFKKASYIMPFGYINIVFAFFSDVLFFKANFDWISIIGMFLTSAGLLTKLLVKEE